MRIDPWTHDPLDLDMFAADAADHLRNLADSADDLDGVFALKRVRRTATFVARVRFSRRATGGKSGEGKQRQDTK
jgi:hypothetical protein